MTNREKYNDKLMAIWESANQFAIDKKTNSLRKCNTRFITCSNCLFYTVHDCISQRAEWLKAEYIESVKTVKASELAVDTVVMCADDEEEKKETRRFAVIFKDKLYAQSQVGEGLINWKYMWLEDGTVVLAE